MRVKSFFVALVAICASSAFGWGHVGHQLTVEGAVPLLGNAPYGPWLKRNLYILKRYSVTPDDDWKAGFGEPPASPLVAAERERINAFEHQNHFAQPDAFIRPSRLVNSRGRVNV